MCSGRLFPAIFSGLSEVEFDAEVPIFKFRGTPPCGLEKSLAVNSEITKTRVDQFTSLLKLLFGLKSFDQSESQKSFPNSTSTRLFDRYGKASDDQESFNTSRWIG